MEFTRITEDNFIKLAEENAKLKITPEALCEGFLYQENMITFDPNDEYGIISIETELNLNEMKALVAHMEKYKQEDELKGGN